MDRIEDTGIALQIGVRLHNAVQRTAEWPAADSSRLAAHEVFANGIRKGRLTATFGSPKLSDHLNHVPGVACRVWAIQPNGTFLFQFLHQFAETTEA